MKLFEPKFWENEWEKAIQSTNNKTSEEKIEMWNSRADNFDKNVSSSSGQERLKETINFLDKYGVLDQGPKTILDLGCGPGHYAIEFARRGHKVYAMDPAEKMIDKLNEKLGNENKEVANKIIPLVDDWFKLDIEEKGYNQKFDLVFASMCPAIHDAKNLQKVIDASKKYCFISRFAGEKFRKSISYLLEKHLGRQDVSHMDIIYPLNWLYSKGYKPELHFDSWSRLHKQPKEEAKNEIQQMLGMFLTVDDEVKNDIEDYVEKHQEEGYLTEEKGATAGMVLFDTEGKCIKYNKK
ncbi:class I SAM-dependent methyltransferase [Natranaerofaba carboxydovora]|uniref:class I SAM-dependent methyltransferase n=1 Tax=Natranaerofaba carboxydovora TaxID=2742683 RepID=UPI001F12DB2D|nr:class I SAM-dependent methyltransferase [Natranaerofaba carboxydovora]UMZ72956.1 Methyltransferase domain protein [Natranaerofaba carboxydovora]